MKATRAAARAGFTGINRTRHLIADLRKVDGHLAAGDCDFHLQRHRPVEIDAVAVEERLGNVIARLDARDFFPRQSFGLIPDGPQALQEDVAAVAMDQLREAAISDAAGGDLGAQIA